MRTHGYKVYRYNGRYYIYNYHCDSYPRGLGLDVLHEIPRMSREKFEEWLRKIRKHLYEKRDSKMLEDLICVSDKQPDMRYSDFDVDIERIYEIDLDNLVFHVDNQPLFRLDNMPPDDIFLTSISCDHFGHCALHEHTPTEFRYNWHSPPPSPLPESLVAYNRYINRSFTSSVHDLMSVPVALSPIERVRTSLAELLVTTCMADSDVGHDVRVLESVTDRDHIPQSMLKFALSLVNFAVGPPIPTLPCPPYSGDTSDFVWICEDVCLRITTHLDDEDILKASIGDLVHHIDTTLDKVGTIYGIACSIFHCAVVRVNKDGLGTSFAHTPALEFLPSFYARTMFTPGIEALSRLGCQTSGVKFLNAIYDANNIPRFTHELLVTGSVVSKVPVEVWSRIGSFITSPADLVTLSSISAQAMLAAADLTRFPLVDEFRLVDVIASGPKPIPETHKEDTNYYYRSLCWTRFTAVRGGRCLDVELHQLSGRAYARFRKLRREISFEVQTYLSNPVSVFRTKNALMMLVGDRKCETS